MEEVLSNSLLAPPGDAWAVPVLVAVVSTSRGLIVTDPSPSTGCEPPIRGVATIGLDFQ
jgi:hypothetical protein